MPKYSIVVPFHNEEQNVTELYDRLKAVMEGTLEPFELVFVDDGSSDHTFSLLQQIAAVDRRVVVVKLRRKAEMNNKFLPKQPSWHLACLRYHRYIRPELV